MRRNALLAVLLAAIGACHRQEPQPPQPAPAAATTPAEKAPMAIVRDGKGKRAPTVEVTDLRSGQAVTLDSFKGKALLVNLWATWCAPCVRELPTLDRLAAADPAKLAVIAISEDMEGAKVVQPFLAKTGIRTLAPYHDRDNALMLALKQDGLPLTVLYDAEGKEVWRVPGDLDWSGPKAKALLAEAGI